jgi:hypothetical protein
VNDTEKPAITCPADAVDQITNAGCTLIPATLADPTVSDNCSVASLSFVLSGATTYSSPVTGMNYARTATFNVGVTTVTYTVTDVNGNTNTCSHIVWIKNLNAPQFSATCPVSSTINQDAAQNRCDADVTIPAPTISNPCGEVFSVSYQVDSDPVVAYFTGTGTTVSPVTLTLPVGPHTFTWTVTDASGNVKTCPMTVTVNDLLPSLTCPPDVVVQAEFEVEYNSTVATADPTWGDNCPDPVLTWTLTPPAGYETQYAAADLAGTDVYPSPNKFYLGVTTITYTVTDSNGHQVTCNFTVTVLAKPVIACAPDYSTVTDPGLCTAKLNSDDYGLPTLQEGVQPITWTWTITNPDGSAGPTGSFVGSVATPGPPSVPDYDFLLGTSTITWKACNVSGCAECTQQIKVEDKEKPTFVSEPVENCVLKIQEATYDPSTDDITPPRPEYWVMVAGDASLDLDPSKFADNCDLAGCTPEIRWKITMADGSTIPATDPYFVGQPSTYGTDITFPGDGINFTDVVHHITYWIVDCHGNVSDPQTQTITITPRPEITKHN